LQTRLLRVLQEREVLRVGATEPTPVQVRVIAATHRDLARQVEQGAFRLDLYYRLNILRIEVPSLRERLADLPEILQALVRKQLDRLASGARSIERRCEPLFEALLEQAPHHSWPGNVRELDNMIERLLACAPTDWPQPLSTDAAQLALRELVPELFVGPRISVPAALTTSAAMSEREQAEAVLAACAGDKAEACRRLGISRTTLWRKLKGP